MVHRLMIILSELLDKKTVTANYLASLLGVSTRTIYRYVDELSLCNIPVYNKKGRNGGISIGEEYKIYSNTLTKIELEKLRDLSQKLVDSDKQVFDNIISKINSVNNNTENHVSTQNLYFYNGNNRNNISNKIITLEKAILNNLKVNITYVSRNQDKTNRNISPLNFVVSNNEWYLYAYCNTKNDFRVFKLTRIINIEVTNAKFKEYKGYEKKWKFDFLDNLDKVDIVIKVNENARYDIEEWLGIENVRLDNQSKSIIAHQTLPFNDELIYKLLSFGDKIEVLEPKIVIDKLQNIINKIKTM